jgi:hypothetical protein
LATRAAAAKPPSVTMRRRYQRCFRYLSIAYRFGGRSIVSHGSGTDNVGKL